MSTCRLTETCFCDNLLNIHYVRSFGIVMERKVRTYSKNELLVRERRREIIFRCTKEFVKKGFDRTTMRDLAKAFGLSTGALYHYIGSKEDILYMSLNYITERADEYIGDIKVLAEQLTPSEALKAAIERHIRYVDEHQDMIIFHDQVVANVGKSYRKVMFDTADRMVALFLSLLNKGVESGEFEVANPELWAMHIFQCCRSWATLRWYFQRRFSLEEYIKVHTGFVFASIRKEGKTTEPEKQPATLF